MEITVAAQTTMFWHSLLLGALLGAVYDVFRIIRQAFRHGWLAVLLEDILFFLLGIVLLSVFFMQQGGEVRIFVIIGALLGWVIYYFSVGSWVMGMTHRILSFLSTCYHAVERPTYKAVIWCKITINKTLKPFIKQINRLKSHLHLLYNENVRTQKTGGGGRWRSQKKKK